MNNIYWTEPFYSHEQNKWQVNKKFKEDTIEKQYFKNKVKAWDFLKTINVYVDNELVVSKVS